MDQTTINLLIQQAINIGVAASGPAQDFQSAVQELCDTVLGIPEDPEPPSPVLLLPSVYTSLSHYRAWLMEQQGQ